MKFLNYKNKFSLDNKVVFVTGGCGLLGKEICIAFATTGAKTIILDINDNIGKTLCNELCNENYDVHYEHFDVTDLNDIENKILILNEKYKKIDVWVNSAYPRTNDWSNNVENLNLDSWKKNIDMHLNSYSWISKTVALIMKNQNSGNIINFGSIYGVKSPDFSVYAGTDLTCPMAYSAIKGGIINLTRYLASYFGKYNVRINSICPGGILNGQNEIFLKNYECKVPLKRLGKPDEVASVVLFLASEASSYISGNTLMVDGGWSII